MVFCFKCGKPVEAHWNFCTACGSPLGKSSSSEVPSKIPGVFPLFDHKVLFEHLMKKGYSESDLKRMLSEDVARVAIVLSLHNLKLDKDAIEDDSNQELILREFLDNSSKLWGLFRKI